MNKRYLRNLSVLCSLMLMFCFISCGGYGTDYKKACEKQDWKAAYEIVDKLKAQYEEAVTKKEETRQFGYITGKERPEFKRAKKESEQKLQSYEEALHYVVLQEAISVIEEDGVNGIQRIIGIAKEHNADSWLYGELCIMAAQSGDTELSNELMNMFSGHNTNDFDQPETFIKEEN